MRTVSSVFSSTDTHALQQKVPQTYLVRSTKAIANSRRLAPCDQNTQLPTLRCVIAPLRATCGQCNSDESLVNMKEPATPSQTICTIGDVDHCVCSPAPPGLRCPGPNQPSLVSDRAHVSAKLCT